MDPLRDIAQWIPKRNSSMDPLGEIAHWIHLVVLI